MLGHWINIYNLCYHYCCFVVLFYHKLVKLLKIALLGHYLGKHWTSMGHAKMKLNFFFWHSTNYSKRHTTVVLRIDTAKHDQMSQKCKIEMSLDVSNWFFLNWLFSRGFGKKNFFSQNWREEWNKEIHCSKNIHCLKLKLYHFLN